MFKRLQKKFQRKNSSQGGEIEPDEIFLDSSNLPEFNTHQFEGRLEKPISKRTFVVVGIFFILIGLVFTWKIWDLQVKDAEMYLER